MKRWTGWYRTVNQREEPGIVSIKLALKDQLAIRAPCDHCYKASLCKKLRMACARFEAFVSGYSTWKIRALVPSRRIYLKVFEE